MRNEMLSDAAAQRDFIATLVPTGESSSRNTVDSISCLRIPRSSNATPETLSANRTASSAIKGRQEDSKNAGDKCRSVILAVRGSFCEASSKQFASNFIRFDSSRFAPIVILG